MFCYSAFFKTIAWVGAIVRRIFLFLCQGIFIYCPWLWVDGMALFPFVLTRHRHNAPWFVQHERIHLWQQLETGIVPFYIFYLLQYAVLRLVRQMPHHMAYTRLSAEREAYAQQHTAGYLGEERRFYGWLLL